MTQVPQVTSPLHAAPGPSRPAHPLTAIYLWSVVTVGGVVVVNSALTFIQGRVGVEWFLLAGLTLLSGAVAVRVRPTDVSLSFSDAFVFAVLLLFGTAAATVTLAIDTLAFSLALARSRRLKTHQVLFNITGPCLAMFAAGTLFYWMADEPVRGGGPEALSELVAPLVVCAVVYAVLGIGLLAGAVALEQSRHFLQVFSGLASSSWVGYATGPYVAAMLVVYSRDTDLPLAIAYLAPIPLIVYYAFRISVGRMEDQLVHLAEVNRGHARVIEALAHAIDAKDQVTHGHIRRVQRLCLEVAREFGVSEQAELRAIDAAALLHDVGKLAVPEHILNKPGKLTPAEFEEMKRHATAGAEIVSQVEFPFPVVPIVRHHHESWDGTGYPDGLRGTDIPVGARILAVVDCFDALTSDRPYRPRLSDADAMSILRERRGSMYDPAVLDAFERIHHVLARVAHERPAFPEREVPAEMHAQRSQLPATSPRVDGLCAEIRSILPADVCVFFEYDVHTDLLVARAAAGLEVAHFVSLQMRRGERVSGWVAATGEPALNSDARLDLREVASTLPLVLRSALSVPAFSGGLVGVVTAYSAVPDAFDTSHLETCQSRVSAHFAQTSHTEPH